MILVKVEVDSVVLSCATEYAQEQKVSIKEWVENAIVQHAGRCEDAKWQPSRPVDVFARELFIHMFINCRTDLPSEWIPLAALIEADEGLWRCQPLPPSLEEFRGECFGESTMRVLDVDALNAAWPRLVSRVF